MTRIEGIGWPAAPRVSPRVAGKPGFFVPVEPAETGHAAATNGPQAASPGSMLSLQEFGAETVADREARRHGRDMLAALADLQRALLRGDDAATLQRLVDLVASVPSATDPRLAAMVSAIGLRVRVELAKRRQNGCMSAC